MSVEDVVRGILVLLDPTNRAIRLGRNQRIDPGIVARGGAALLEPKFDYLTQQKGYGDKK